MKDENQPIRVECHCLVEEKRESIGFVLVQMRSVALSSTARKTGTLKPRWHKLMGVPLKWRTLKPEVSICVAITDRLSDFGGFEKEAKTLEEPLVMSPPPEVLDDEVACCDRPEVNEPSQTDMSERDKMTREAALSKELEALSYRPANANARKPSRVHLTQNLPRSFVYTLILKDCKFHKRPSPGLWQIRYLFDESELKIPH